MQYTHSSPLRFFTTTHGPPSSGTVKSETHQNSSNIDPSNVDHIIRGNEKRETSVPIARKNMGNARPYEFQIATEKAKEKKRRAPIATKQGWLRLTEFWPQHRLFLASSRNVE